MSVVSQVFERMLSAGQIEDHTKTTLKKWLPTYLSEEERQLGVDPNTFEIPRNYSERNSFDAEAGEVLPKIVVIAPGTIGDPIKKGNGKYSATWRLGVGIAIAASTEEMANSLVKGYAAAIRGVMLQNSELDSLNAVDITWIEESYDDLPIPDQIQLLKAASLYFDIDFDNVITRGGGPVVPDQPSYDYGQFETVVVDVEKV